MKFSPKCVTNVYLKNQKVLSVEDNSLVPIENFLVKNQENRGKCEGSKFKKLNSTASTYFYYHRECCVKI